MKKSKLFSFITMIIYVISTSILITSCSDDVGVTYEKLRGDEKGLPDELKGLKVYSISIEGGNYVKVATLNNAVNSTTYQSGKVSQSLITLEVKNGNLVKVDQILLENDSLIICKKQKEN